MSYKSCHLLWRRRSATRTWKIALNLFGLLFWVAPGLVFGQFFSAEQLNPLKTHLDGLQLYGVSAFTTYVSAMPGYVAEYGNEGYQLGAGATANIGWNRIRGRSKLSAQYAFMYSDYSGIAASRALSHRLSLGASRRLGYRWNLDVSADAQILNSSDLMFNQGVFSQAVDLNASFNDLAAAVLAGRLTSNNDIAALLTQSSASGGTAQTLFFGNRILNTVVQTHLSYRYSPRLLVHFDAGASRNQGLPSAADQNSANRTYLVPRVTVGSVQTGLSYSLSPRTTVGVDFSSQRMFATVEDAYTTTGMVSVGRVMGNRWFANVHAGVGVITPVRTGAQLPQGPQAVEGGMIGFKTFTQTVALSVDRTIVDSYAIGASSTLNSTLGWSWRRPGRSWSVLASVGQQRIASMNFPVVTAWQTTVGFSRLLSRGTIMTVAYGYLNTSGGPLTSLYAPATHGVRVMIRWTPGGGVMQ